MDAVLIGLLPDVPPEVPGVRVTTLAQAQDKQLPLVLGWFDGRLALKATTGKETPLAVDFTAGKQGYRLAADRVRHERLVKALGGIPESALTVIDATAGLGRDALVMAQAGFQIILLERSPILHAMLADGISRLAREEPALAARLTLYHADSLDWLAQCAEPVFAVYLDPMFPQRQKSAAVKKDLLWLQQLESAPTAEQEETLLTLARRCADKRVVVKRPLRAPSLAGKAPSWQLAGKSVRFDIYTGSVLAGASS